MSVSEVADLALARIDAHLDWHSDESGATRARILELETACRLAYNQLEHATPIARRMDPSSFGDAMTEIEDTRRMILRALVSDDGEPS